MNILVIPGNHNLDNLGDTVMLMVTARWMKELISDLTLSVVTQNPDRLKEILPHANPVVIGNPRKVPRGMVELVAHSQLLKGLYRYWRYRSWTDRVQPALSEADSLILSGQGIMTDSFSHEAMWRLDLLERAYQHGKQTALFSQGLGPITNSGLAARMKRVLPNVDLIVLRNGKDASTLQAMYGCTEDQLRIGGDDGLAYPHRSAKTTSSKYLGVSIRLAEYSGVHRPSDPSWQGLRGRILEVAESLGASILPVPIEEGDLLTVEKSFGLEIGSASIAEVDELIDRIADCRLVLTGSYHSAVFALAMGIPAICLVFSDYYASKFEGLAEQFPEGCTIFDSRTMRLSAFDPLVISMWEEAPTISERLAFTSKTLVATNWNHYRDFSKLLTQ